MSQIGIHRPIDHTGDLGIEAEAPDEESVYATCASAMFGILADLSAVRPGEAMEIEVSAGEREILLVRWLRELLYLHGSEGWLFTEFDVACSADPDGRLRLRGRALGERLDPARHAVRTEIKAVTYHQAAVLAGAGGTWRARVVFDV